MTTRLARRALTAVLTVLSLVFVMASPSSATTYENTFVMTDGTISVSFVDFLTPGSGVTTCPGSTVINSVIDETTSTVDADLNIQSPFMYTGDAYKLTATGSATTHGDYHPETETFTAMHFGTINFNLMTLNPTTCVASTTVLCSGMAQLTVTGGITDTTGLPIGSGGTVFINGDGQITTVTSCPFPFNFIIFQGASLSIGPNNFTDGAIFCEP